MSDLVGPTGTVYAVEFSHRSGRDLIGMATKRTNVIPIVEEYVFQMLCRADADITSAKSFLGSKAKLSS